MEENIGYMLVSCSLINRFRSVHGDVAFEAAAAAAVKCFAICTFYGSTETLL